MNIGNIRPGTAIVLGDELFQVLGCEHAKLGRGAAFLRAKLKNINSGRVAVRTLRDSDKIEEAFIEKRKIKFLYRQGHFYHFMDLASYDDFPLSEDRIEELSPWLKEDTELEGMFFNNKLIDLQIGSALELEVLETEPGFRGDTVKQGLKSAKLETGATVQVPLFINTGDKIKVNPRTGQYLGRV